MGFSDARRPKSYPDEWPVRLESNLGALPFAVFIVDLDGIVTAWNGLADRVFGVVADSAIGRKLIELRVVEPMAALVDHVRRVGITRVPITISDVPLTRSSQAVRLSVSALTDDASRVVGCLVVAEDRHVSNAPRDGQEETGGANDVFVAMLAHELRNPLAPILSAAYIIKRVTDPDAAAASRVIQRQVGHLARLVDDLLDVARLRHGRIELRRERLGLAAATADVLESTRHNATAMGVQLSAIFPSEPIFVDADPIRLAQILGNLVNNAVKYTGPRGEVTVTGAAEGDMAVLHVKDTGIGIAPQTLPRVFDLFMQADASLDRTRGGLGIGLSLVKSLVEVHGGAVSAHSEGLGHGSLFVLRLPLAKSAPDVVPSPVTAAALRSVRTVVIVEDNRDAREMLRTTLELERYVVTTAADGLAGLREIRRANPDLVLIDLGLPGLDGFETARQVRAMVGEDVLLVALTGYGDAESRRRAIDAGFDLHVVKPVDPEELLRLIAAYRRADPR